MSRGRLPGRLLLLLAPPLLILGAGAIVAERASREPRERVEARLAARAPELRAAFTELLQSAAQAARLVLDKPASQEQLRARIAGPLRDRLEGAGVLGPDNGFRSWVGMPAEPDPPVSGAPLDWSVRVEGLWTRLVVRTASDPAGRSGIASFVLDGPRSDERFALLLPRAIGDRLVDVDFVEDPGAGDDLSRLGASGSVLPRRGSAALVLPLASPAGEILALVTLEELSPAQRASLWIGDAGAVAALAFALLVSILFDWRALCRSGAGRAAALGALGVCRALLLAARAPARLLPRELGTPSLYGSPEAWGLVGSPADLLLSALAVFLLWRVLRRTLEEQRARLLALGAASALTAGVVLLAFLLERDAQLPLLQLGAIVRSPGAALLLSSLALALVTGAEAWACVFGFVTPRARTAPLRAATLALIPLVAAATLTIVETRQRLGLDRLRSEFAPDVLEQGSRRRVALLGSAHEAAAADAAADAVLAPTEPGNTYVAYLLWADSDLFHSGYQSALDVYDATGERRSHFGFNLPPLSENVELPAPGSEPTLKTEGYHEVVAHSVKLLHSSAPIVREGRSVGSVVVHVLDEPENLSFLPSSLPYLAALGFGAPHGGVADALEAPAYALYDADGTLLLSTIAQPPAAAPLRRAAARHATLRVVAGRELYLALPLEDAGRMHVLLLPASSVLDHLGAFLRLFLLAGAALLAIAAIPLALEPRALLGLRRGLHGSFYRKLLVVLLLASAVPLLGLSLFVRSYVEHRAQGALVESASRLVQVVASVIEDYAATEVAEEPMAVIPEMNDEILDWLRRVVRQEIHLYENGLVSATSKRELFASGLLPVRIPGEVEERLVAGGAPYVVQGMRLGGTTIPVAYTRLRLPGAAVREAIAAVPLVLQQRDLARAINRVSEMLLLATALLAVLLAGSAALLARSVARPVRELVEATRRIAAGDTGTRLTPTTGDELGELVHGFNAMAAALAAQRVDLVRSNQLAAWAEMARAIAHEIKNPLTPIQLSTEHLRRLLADRSLLPWPEIEACVETVLKQVRSLREIAAEFSTYAKLPDLAPEATEPAELLRGVLAPYRAALPGGVELVERYAPCPRIAADRRVLARALVNLVENALHAMSGGGTLSVSAEHDASRGEVVLQVADTGPGLAPEVRARLFEPYFSTKSSGTGLGLAIVRRAVEGHHGMIEAESAPGAGTVFRIRLPEMKG